MRIKSFCEAGLVFFLLCPILQAKPLEGQIIVDPQHKNWMVRYSSTGNHKPVYIGGLGDPEGFLYGDFCCNGSQTRVINDLKNNGGNAIYLMAVRSHGGDGDSRQNPFINNDPSKGVDQNVLNKWEGWFAEMDKNDIVIYFYFYDDGAKPFSGGDAVPSGEKAFVEAIVNKFEHHKNLIWCVAEESSEAYSKNRIINIAKVIAAADDHDHIIATHQLNNTSFNYAGGSLDQFSMQYGVSSIGGAHNAAVSAVNKAAGGYSVMYAEIHPFGFELISKKDRTGLRKMNWGIAMGGAGFLSGGPYSEKRGAPMPEMLKDMGKIVGFFQDVVTDYGALKPADSRKYDNTEYVLAGDNSFVAYSTKATGEMGVKSLPAGTYTLVWYDCVSGNKVVWNDKQVSGGNQNWMAPNGIGSEAALYITKGDATTVVRGREEHSFRPVRAAATHARVFDIRGRDCTYNSSRAGARQVTIVKQPSGALRHMVLNNR